VCFRRAVLFGHLHERRHLPLKRAASSELSLFVGLVIASPFP
jgi:hypothetical protein